MYCKMCEAKMVHMEDIEAFNDESSNDGYGERKIEWDECPSCSYQTECDCDKD